jgi:hypothetical protein
MDIQQLRQSLKMKWLDYYEENHHWLVKMQVWHTYDDLRRPSSGYILATLSVLEPQFQQILSFILDLNQNPDQIILALGLHFNPEQELCLLKPEDNRPQNQIVSLVAPQKLQAAPSPIITTQKLPSSSNQVNKQVLFRVSTGITSTYQSLTVVAVPPQVDERYSAKTLVLEQQQLEKSPIHQTTFSLNPAPKYSQHHQPIPPSPRTNARNLPAWVDEFCAGVGW